MLPPSLAIAWTLWRRNRGGLLLMAGYLGAACVLSAVLPALHLSFPFDKAFFGIVTMPLIWVAMCLVGICCFGFDADLNARESCFPAALFTLPIRTGALAGWPLVFGAAAAGLLWLTTACFILRPWLALWGGTVALWWPAMLAIALAAWMQALLWLPFGLPGVRIVLAIVVFAGFAVANGKSMDSGMSEGKLLAIYTGVAAVAWGCAYLGVRRGRCGEVPNWDGLLRPLRRLGAWLPRSRQPFASAARAQVWFEWRRTGLSLPIMTGLVVPTALLPLLLGKNDVIFTWRTLLSALAFPVLLAGWAGTTVSGRHPWVKDYYGVPPFTATLPMATARMVGAKLKGAALSVLAAWTLVAVMVPLAVVLTGTLDEVEGWWQQALIAHGPAKVVAAMVSAAFLLLVSTWKRHVDTLFLGLTGRTWVIQTAFPGMMVALVVLGSGGAWIYHHPETHEFLLSMLPWLLGALVLARLATAGLALRQALRRGLLAPRTVTTWVASGFLLAAVLTGLLAWSVSAEVVPWYYLAFGVSLCLPMVRLAATPLALAWNRHR